MLKRNRIRFMRLCLRLFVRSWWAGCLSVCHEGHQRMSHRLLTWGMILLCTIQQVACRSNVFVPKPRGYPRLELPDHCYQALPDSLPYTFEYSVHARLLNDSSSIAERYWMTIDYPIFSAKIQITYKEIKKEKPALLKEYLTDSYRLTAKHQMKARSIKERILWLKNGKKASISYLKGEVPTPIQFHTTDSLRHYLRGALYFNTATKNDSLQPVIQYMEKDILHLLSTLGWRQ